VARSPAVSTRRKLQRQHKRNNPTTVLPEVAAGRAFGASSGLLSAPGRYEQECPVCGAEVQEVGGLGCCGAITANCAGAIDGAPADVETFEDDDPRWDRVVQHYWYTDTGERAPHETQAPGVRCRCEA
jgi:hypothetical protein